jgi:hypothetical protein
MESQEQYSLAKTAFIRSALSESLVQAMRPSSAT